MLDERRSISVRNRNVGLPLGIEENVQDTESFECDVAAMAEAGTMVLDARFAIGVVMMRGHDITKRAYSPTVVNDKGKEKVKYSTSALSARNIKAALEIGDATATHSQVNAKGILLNGSVVGWNGRQAWPFH